MIINQQNLLTLQPIQDMIDHKVKGLGLTSFGLTEGGYDIRIKQTISFNPLENWIEVDEVRTHGTRFTLASSREFFQLPENLLGIVHDKSTLARKGLSVFNTVIEPGWKGFLTLELVYHGSEPLTIPAGTGIAQIIFHELKQEMAYNGKYQNQADKPIEAIHEE